MYGLLLEGIVEYIKMTYGEDKWVEIQQLANVEYHSFSAHEVYPECIIPNLAQAAAEVTATPIEEVMEGFGSRFVMFVGQYGYDRILKVLGRHLRDFLNGLDNLHEYLRFSYKKLSAPSFFCENETEYGLTLHYRSRRKGFVHYVKGQIRQVAMIFYNTELTVQVISEECVDGINHVVMQLNFDNTAFIGDRIYSSIVRQSPPVKSDIFFEIFPFNIVFTQHMVIRHVGAGLSAVMSHLEGQTINEQFSLVRPLVNFTWNIVLMHTNSVFELKSSDIVHRDDEDELATTSNENNLNDTDYTLTEGRHLHLKGQMLYFAEWDSIIFLGTPVMDNLDKMFQTGLYINDLSMHDSSRDLVLAGTQQSAELKLALDQEQQKSRILEESMRKLDNEMKRTDSLLYQMIPKTVADRLRTGEPAMNTCEVFECVTILFSDVVGFTTICSKITPLGVVSMLNAMYTLFDQLSEKHNVYKVETIGDAYMTVAGAPNVTKYHALHICNMALDMLGSMCNLKDPSTQGNMKIRVGIHSGTAVAGVVGVKMPRYCLFGDTVNTASRMETSGEAMKIHISAVTRAELEPYPYVVTERGLITIKGKGSLKTYWLMAKQVAPDSALVTSMAAELQKIEEVHRARSPSPRQSFSRASYTPVLMDDAITPSKTVNSNGQPLLHPSNDNGAVNTYGWKAITDPIEDSQDLNNWAAGPRPHSLITMINAPVHPE